MEELNEIFGTLVFNNKVMQNRLPKLVYTKLQQNIKNGKDLDQNTAESVAFVMKEWALEKGATHFTHWFQPMTGITAEKHESFVNPSKNGEMILSFSGKELIKGEPDASSFPSGGLRATFEARGYTAWDTTSYAFIKGKTLCIPTVFISYTGEVLDRKTPLLRSMQALNNSGKRIIKLFGQDDVNIITNVGAEQEYFLIDKSMYEQRKDLKYTGRTILGARPAKGQEMDDHYFGSIRPRVLSFMEDLDSELWKLGIFSKTRHNEVAPSQHELASVFTTANIAMDQNQQIMDVMKKTADKHNLACLLHEKPFNGINGSGKHNNWSLSTDKGVNLLEPGDNPRDNAQFLLFLTAVIAATDKYQDLLRATTASAGNDLRLGGSEAPPAIVSMFIGDNLQNILEDISNGRATLKEIKVPMTLGIDSLPKFTKDATDRNRTSPFAFTLNRFEFRMLGSEASLSGPNVILNTAVAEMLDIMADRLEKADNFELELTALISETYSEHKRIVFNGNNYSDDWKEEAKKRELENLVSTADAAPSYIREKNIKLFEKYKIFTRAELVSRYTIMIENYCKTLNIEALTLIDMILRQILPAARGYQKQLSDEIISVKKACDSIKNTSSLSLLSFVSSSVEELAEKTEELKKVLALCSDTEDLYKKAVLFHSKANEIMKEIRIISDQMELALPSSVWPIPSYGDLLYSV